MDTNKKAVLFDLDGTLIDSKPGIFNAIDYTMEQLHLPMLSEETKDRFIGPSIGTSFRDVCGFDEETVQTAITLFRTYYKAQGMFECALYPQIDALIRLLRSQGKTIALATKKPEVFAIEILKKLGVFDLFDVVCGADYADTSAHKTYIIERAVEACGCPKEACVLLGDTRFDCIGAGEAGIECIGVAYGYGTVEELQEHGAVSIAGNASELAQILCGVLL